MTLVLAAANLAYTASVADRRLTAESKVEDEEFSKAILLSVPEGRVGVAFSGLATAPGFRMNLWLPAALLEVARSETNLDRIVDGVCERLNRAFASLPDSVPPKAKPTALLFVGYTYDERDRPRFFWRGVANYRANANAVTDFAVERDAEKERFNHISALGQWRLPGDASIHALGELVDQHEPPEAVVGKAVKLVRESAAKPQARNGIGGQISSVVFPSDRLLPAVAGYHSEVLADRVFSPGLVSGTDRGGMAVMEASVISGAVSDERVRKMYLESLGQRKRRPRLEFPPIAIPKVGRNAPCPCRSGKKHKRCHGRHPEK